MEAPEVEQEHAEETESILYGLDAWVAYLSDKSFPVRASSLKRLKSLLSKDSTMISDLSALVKTDPIMCLHVTREAEVRHAEKGSHVTSIEHAVSSMGMDPLEEMARKLKPVKLNPSSVQQKQYLRSIADSHHAAYQARAWLQMKNLPFAEEVYLAALFYNIGTWALWLNAPIHMHQIQSKVWDENIDQTLAEHDVLGCTIQKISLGLAEVWGLSELTRESQDPDTSPSKATLAKLHQRALDDPRLDQNDIRELNHLTQERFFPIKLSNWLAQIVNRGWRSTRNVQITDIVGDYLGMDTEHTMPLLHKLCANASRIYHAPGTLAPAAEMLFIPSSLTGNYKLGKKEFSVLSTKFPKPEKPKPKKKLKPAPKTEVIEQLTHLPETFTNQEIFTQTIERFLKGYHLYTKPAHILQGLTQGLVQGLGFPRVALNLINVKNHSMRAAQVVGFSKEDPIATYQIDLQIPSLFKKMADKPNCVWINDGNRSQYARLIPEDYQAFLTDSDCLLMSVFKKNTPIAILYVDGGTEGLKLKEFHQERFKYICSAATLALKRLD